MKKVLFFLLLVTILCSTLSSCDMSSIGTGYPGLSNNVTTTDNQEDFSEDGDNYDDDISDGNIDEDTTDAPEGDITETDVPETTPPATGPVLSHTYYLSGPYDVKGGYVSGTESPTVTLSLSDIFDLNMLEEQDFLCRMTVTYNAAVQGDHLNLRFSMTVGGVFMLVDDYRYMDTNQTATQNHGVYSIDSQFYNRTGDMALTWDTKGVTGFDGLNHCKITDVSVCVEFYKDDTQTNQPEETLLTEYSFILSGSYTVRGGYISGTTTPSVSVDLSEAFNLQALAEQGYYCNIYVTYTAEVQGDHLNIRSTLDGPTTSVSDYTFLEDNEKRTMSHSATNIISYDYSAFSTLNIKWDCKGITAFDGLNECIVSNVCVEVRFQSDKQNIHHEGRFPA